MWGSGFLPSTHQGVPFLNGADPILNLSSPKGFDSERQGDFFNTVNDLNALRLKQVGDPEISTRISAYEMAYRMQSSVPKLTDMSGEPEHILKMYGPDVRKPGTFAANCLLARRMAERDVRFIQVTHSPDGLWDQHFNLPFLKITYDISFPSLWTESLSPSPMSRL